jgi:DNA-binding transcriptional regulator YdaS (Cro superfamily)
MSNTDIWQKIVISELASRLNISRGSVYKWKWANKIPAERVVAVEAITGIKREELRPDLYAQSHAANG